MVWMGCFSVEYWKYKLKSFCYIIDILWYFYSKVIGIFWNVENFLYLYII